MVFLLVENLPRLVIEKDMDDLFSRYGRIASMQIKFPSHETTIALVEYASTKEGDDANRELQGLSYQGNRLRTELWQPSADPGPRSHLTTQHRVHISHLPPSATATDVNSLLAGVADVLAIEVDRRGNAWASFPTHHELDRVINKIDDTEYRGERLRVKRDELSIASLGADPQALSITTGRSSSTLSAASAPSPTASRTSRHEQSRSRSRSPTRYRRSPSRSPGRHRSTSERRSRSRSQSPTPRSSSRRYTSRSRSRSR